MNNIFRVFPQVKYFSKKKLSWFLTSEIFCPKSPQDFGFCWLQPSQPHWRDAAEFQRRISDPFIPWECPCQTSADWKLRSLWLCFWIPQKPMPYFRVIQGQVHHQHAICLPCLPIGYLKSHFARYSKTIWPKNHPIIYLWPTPLDGTFGIQFPTSDWLHLWWGLWWENYSVSSKVVPQTLSWSSSLDQLLGRGHNCSIRGANIKPPELWWISYIQIVSTSYKSPCFYVRSSYFDVFSCNDLNVGLSSPPEYL